MNKTIKNKINLSQNEGLSPSCIALSFDGFGSISWHSIWIFWLLYSFHNFSHFQLFWPEYHWRDLSSRNAHLVHQNRYRISFYIIWRRHHCWWRASKFRPMLGAEGLWTGRDLYRWHTFCDTGPRFFRSHPKDRPIQSRRLSQHAWGPVLTRILTGSYN
jgi:hypothetical protein